MTLKRNTLEDKKSTKTSPNGQLKFQLLTTVKTHMQLRTSLSKDCKNIWAEKALTKSLKMPKKKLKIS